MVPASKVGLVIGKGGETIKSINQASGAHTEIDKNAPPDAREKNFVIRGPPECVDRAKQMVMEKIGLVQVEVRDWVELGFNFKIFRALAMGLFLVRLSTLLMDLEEAQDTSEEVVVEEEEVDLENITNLDLQSPSLASQLSTQPLGSLTTARSGPSTTGAWA